MDERVARMRERRPMPTDDEPAPPKESKPARGIDFSVVLMRPDGTPLRETPLPTVAQIAQLAASVTFDELRVRLSEISTQPPLTLARACDIALDVGIDADKNEGLKPKIKRGDLMKQIHDAVAAKKELFLQSGDITLLKTRVAAVLTQAYVVYTVCMHLDPVTVEKMTKED